MADLLKTDYKDDLLDTSANTERKFNLVDADGNVIAANVSIQDITAYSQVGDSFGAADINETNEKINSLNGNLANGDVSFSVGEDEHPYITYKVGADTVTKKLGSGEPSTLSFLHAQLNTGSSGSYTTLENWDMIVCLCGATIKCDTETAILTAQNKMISTIFMNVPSGTKLYQTSSSYFFVLGINF